MKSGTCSERDPAGTGGGAQDDPRSKSRGKRMAECRGGRSGPTAIEMSRGNGQEDRGRGMSQESGGESWVAGSVAGGQSGSGARWERVTVTSDSRHTVLLVLLLSSPLPSKSSALFVFPQWKCRCATAFPCESGSGNAVAQLHFHVEMEVEMPLRNCVSM